MNDLPEHLRDPMKVLERGRQLEESGGVTLSKEEQFCLQELREAKHFVDDGPYLLELIEWALKHIDHQARDNASYANAHKVLLAERDKAQQLAMRQAAQIKRMSAGETDPPHCPSCDCGRRS
jgi:hypothetical protein